MKILYFFPEEKAAMFKWQRLHFFDELSRHDVQFEVINPLLYQSFEQANEQLVNTIKGGGYDLFFTSIVNEKVLFKETLLSIKSLGIPSLVLRPDNITIPYNDREYASLFDLFWLTSRETEYLYKQWGANTLFMPYAANPYVFKFKTDSIIRRSCFIGNPYGSRSIMINTLASNSIPVDLFFGREKTKKNDDEINNNEGHLISLQIPRIKSSQQYFNRLKTPIGRRLLWGAVVDSMLTKHDLVSSEQITLSPSLSFEKMMETYAKYALSISFSSTEHTDVLNNPVGRTFLRTFEVPMCGGIQICRYFAELEEYFEEGKEILLYKTQEELIDKSKFYLDQASDGIIHNMKLAARARSESEHTWWCRFTKAFDVLGLKY